MEPTSILHYIQIRSAIDQHNSIKISEYITVYFNYTYIILQSNLPLDVIEYKN